MNKLCSPLAKILVHADGLGTPHPAMVRQRAVELATIAGRSHYTEANWQHARAELHSLPDDVGGDEWAARFMASEADMVAVDVGHHAPCWGLDDERNLVEELYAEGLAEAEHDRMYLASLAARQEEAAELADDEAGKSWR